MAFFDNKETKTTKKIDHSEYVSLFQNAQTREKYIHFLTLIPERSALYTIKVGYFAARLQYVIGFQNTWLQMCLKILIGGF